MSGSPEKMSPAIAEKTGRELNGRINAGEIEHSTGERRTIASSAIIDALAFAVEWYICRGKKRGRTKLYSHNSVQTEFEMLLQKTPISSAVQLMTCTLVMMAAGKKVHQILDE